MKELYKLEIRAPESEYARILALLALNWPYGWEEESLVTGESVFRLHNEKAEALQGLGRLMDELPEAEWQMEKCEATDWQEAWKEFFTPILAGQDLVILPPWLAGQDFGQRRKLLIEPQCAFGTGHHASTVLCLEALEKYGPKAGTCLDLGCGSGILGISAAQRGLDCLALDIDPLAIANANANARLNGVDIRVKEGSIEEARGQKFDLIMANILANPLIAMAPAIREALAPEGVLILSGILDIQAAKVEKAYREQGLVGAVRLRKDEWACLVWARS